MIDRDEANNWIERMMDGEEIPPGVEDYIRQHSECREYQAALERAVSALDALNIPEAPAGLSGQVMDFIIEREEAEALAVAPEPARPRRSIWLDVWNAMLNLIPEIQVPRILQREAVPAVVCACVVLFGIFISPQVEAGKDIRLLEQARTCADWMIDKSDRISNRISSQANGLIDRVTETFQLSPGKKSTSDINETNTSYKDSAYQKYGLLTADCTIT